MASSIIPAQKGSSTRWAEHRDFSYGMCQDVPAYASPEASVYDAVDWLFDTPGKLRKRGGWTTPSSSASDGPVQIGRAINANLTTGGTVYIHDQRAVKLQSIDTSTGTKTDIVTNMLDSNIPAYLGRPAEHLGTVIFPIVKTNSVANAGAPNLAENYCFAGDSTTGVILSSPGSAVISAGSNRITLGGGDTTTDIKVGQILGLSDGGSPANHYVGVVQSVIDSTHFTVSPTPSIGFTPTLGSTNPVTLIDGAGFGGQFVTSFQNRVILAKVVTFGGFNTTIMHPQRVVFSILPDETPSDMPANSIGAFWLERRGYPDDNFFDISASSPLTGMTPVGEGQLLFFSATECFRLTGTLTTQTASTSGVSIDVRRVSSSIGCMADRSIAQTQRGVVFGGLDGVYAYDGSQFRPLMNQRVSNFWRDYVQSSNAIPIGAAIVRGNHYIVSLAQSDSTVVDTLICNLDTLAWGRVSNTQIIGGIPDPLNASITWAGRVGSGGWGANVANRALIRLDPMFAPTSSNRTDGNATAVAPTLKTKSYPEGDANTKKKFRRVQLEYDMRGGSPTLAIGSDTELKVSDASYTTLVTGAGSSTLGTTSLSTEVTFDTGSKLAKGVAIEHQITQTGGSDTTEILGIKHGFQTMREGRSN